MKIFVLVCVFFFGFTSFSQETLLSNNFSKRELKNINQLHLNLENYSFKDASLNNDLKEVAFYNMKRKQNKVWAYIFSGAVTLLLSSGLAINSNIDLHGIKSLMILGSTIYYGASIPFFIGKRKNQKKLKKKMFFVKNKLKASF